MLADPNLRWRMEQIVVRFGALPFPRSQEAVVAELRTLWGVGVDPKDEVNAMVEILLRDKVLLPQATDSWDLDREALQGWVQAFWARASQDPVAVQVPPTTIVAATGKAAGKTTVGLKK